jgi:hypothetical protein
VSPPWDTYDLCTIDRHCTDPEFPSCRHLADAENHPDLALLAAPLEHPAAPSGGNSGYFQRYVPLCTDGSGDHEYSVLGDGVAPTCPEEEWVRCADGTRPSYFIKAGADGPSDEWLIWAGAGGHAIPGETAWASYLTEPSSYGLGVSPNNQRGGLGGMFTDTLGGDPFTDWNRVFVETCTPDRFHGRTTASMTAESIDCSDVNPDCEGILEPPRNDPDFSYDVHLHGALIVEAVLEDLALGVSTYSDHTPGSAVVAHELPAMSDADRVLLTCHSNACNGLHQTLDDRAEKIATFAPQADVRGVFNNFFTATIVGEWAVDETTGDGEIIDDRSIYDQVTTGQSIATDVEGGLAEMSLATWQPGGTQWFSLSLYGAELDSSCVAFHAADTAVCRDSTHVLFNHLNTPFFYNFAQMDSSVIQGGGVLSPYCEMTPGDRESCYFDGVEQAWQQMVRKQAADLVFLGATDRCEADSGAAPYDGIVLWGPRWSSHEGWHNDQTIAHQLSLDGGPPRTLRAAVRRWVDTDGVRALMMEGDPNVHGSASNASLGARPVAHIP